MILFNPFSFIQGGFIGRDSSRFLKDRGSTQSLIRLKQIHSDRIHWIRTVGDLAKIREAEGDALICTLKNFPIAVRSADCVPILIAHPFGVVAAVHAGWRGTRSRILQKTLLEMKEKLNLSLREIRLAIGPSICGKCYEVGEEVAAQFSSFPQSWFDKLFTTSPTQFLLNLKLANQLQAIEVGIPSGQIETRSECTLCDEKDFYSYRGALKRGEKTEGRNEGWIVLKTDFKIIKNIKFAIV